MVSFWFQTMTRSDSDRQICALVLLFLSSKPHAVAPIVFQVSPPFHKRPRWALYQMDICEKPRGFRKRSFQRARLPLSIREYIKACVQLLHRRTLAEAQSRCFKMASLVKPFDHLHCITLRRRNNKMGISVPPTSPSLIVFHLTPSRCVYGGK